jgi:aerobic carbon-monoxide dehydrogenase medium subunit
MKLAPFAFTRAESLDHALDVLGELGTDAKVLAGGQSLIPLMAFRLAAPSHLVDVSDLRETRYVRPEQSGLAVGGTTRSAELETATSDLAPHWGAFADALPLIGHLPIRTRGTIGGSIAHADPSAEYPAVLAALEGEVVARGLEGERVIRAADLFQTYLTTNLAPDEILTEVRLPVMPAGAGYALEEFSRRHGDFAIIGIAAVVVRSGQRCTMARLATAGAGPVPVRLRAAEQILEREGLGEAALDAAARKATELVDPDADIHASADYRRHLTGVLTKRALMRAIGVARG